MTGGMEEIARLRSQRKHYKEATGRELDVKDKTPEEPDTLATIFSDPTKQALFGRLLKRTIPDVGERDAIWAKYLAKESLTPEEEEKLDSARYAFADGQSLIEDVGELFDEEDVKSAAARNPEFARYVSKYGAERMTEIARLQVPAMAMEDPDGLRKIVKGLKDSDKITNSAQYKLLNAGIMRLQSSHNWSDDTVAGLLELKGKKREAAIQEMVKKEYTGFWKTMDWLSSTRLDFLNRTGLSLSQTAAQNAAETLKRIEGNALNKQLDKHLANIGNVLTLSITNDQELQRALQVELLGGRPASVEQAESVKSLDDVSKAQRPLNQAAIVQRWNREKEARTQAMFGARNFGGLPDDAHRDAVRDAFIRDMKKEGEPHGHGIFVQILEMLARAFFGTLETNKSAILR